MDDSSHASLSSSLSLLLRISSSIHSLFIIQFCLLAGNIFFLGRFSNLRDQVQLLHLNSVCILSGKLQNKKHHAVIALYSRGIHAMYIFATNAYTTEV